MPDGYKPATVQEALLHVYMGERAVSELLQQVAALHRRGAPVPGPSAHPPPAAPSAITTLGFHLTRPALHSRRSLHQRVADPRAPVQAPALPVLTPPAFDIAQRASPPPVAPHADTSSTVRAAPGLSGLTAEIPRVVFDDAEVTGVPPVAFTTPGHTVACLSEENWRDGVGVLAAGALATAVRHVAAVDLHDSARGLARLRLQLCRPEACKLVAQRFVETVAISEDHRIIAMLIEFMVDDVNACKWLLEGGILPALIQALDVEANTDATCGSGVIKKNKKSTIGCIVQSLSRSSFFLEAMCATDMLDVFVGMAQQEVKSVAPSGPWQLPAFDCLCNMCHAIPASSLFRQDLAASGMVDVLCGAMQLQEYSRRVQAAESLCSFFANHNVDDASLLATAAIFRVVACPRTIQALVDLAFPRIMKKPVDKTCECFRHKLPWLLAVVARAAPADLKLWCDENVGVRRLLSSSISGFSREGAVWALDILIAMCGRVSKSVLNEFLSRTPCALVWQVSQLVRHEWHSIAFVGIFCTMLLPAAAPTMVVWVSNRMPPPLSSLPWHNSQSHAVAGPLSAERQLAELAFDIVLEISLRGGGTLDSSHALADDVRMHLFNVFLAAAGLDAALALLGSSVYDAKRFALHRDKVATIANLLCDSLQAVCGKLETASAQDVLASQASGAVDLLAGILTGPVRSLIGSDDSRPVAGDASSTCDLHSVLRTTGCTAVTLLEEVVFRWPHCLQPLPDNRVDDGRRDARGMQALVVVHEFLLNSKDLGRFLVRLFLRAFLQVEGCAHVASPKQVSSGISVDTLIAIDAEVSLCTGHVPKAALTDSSVVFDDEMKNWVAALLETELCFPAFCFFLASCSWSVANATLECMVVNSSRLAQTGTNLSVCPPRPVRQVASLLHLAAARFGRLSDSSALPELHFHDLVVQLLLAQSPGKPWMQGSQSDSSMLAEVFAYLWGIGQVSFWYTVPLAMDLRREVARALSVLLDNRDTVQAIALSEDNASCLGVLRQVLRNAPGSFPLFTSTQPGASDASVFDLLSETWTPPGRVLLAALVRLWQISDHTSDGCGLETLARLLSPVLRASTYLIAVCPRPADLFSGSDDVKTVLRVAVQLVMSPPAMSDASPNDWQRLGGELMVPLLHRPPVVEMLNDPVDQVLCDIKGGIEALTWCASYTLSGAGLPGSWGSKARSLLSFVSAQSSQTAPSPPERSCSEVARGNAVDAGFSESNSTEEDDATAAAVQARNLQEELSALNAELGALDLELAETSSQGERDCGSPEVHIGGQPMLPSPYHSFVASGNRRFFVTDCGGS
ncbi:hypothetical protein AK812_SmicGene29691 [Symbiodinium microadriaticum]|uniref:Uncharacterized protein n=1 Tax=Symbiodinium microadriaticum TaxID=2951 RepID=A0A1Q9D165_SYMMI|nr:hypothetical protein AK812_SmicGene29691 [Symbiodinium microadriaticum]